MDAIALTARYVHAVAAASAPPEPSPTVRAYEVPWGTPAPVRRHYSDAA